MSSETDSNSESPEDTYVGPTPEEIEAINVKTRETFQSILDHKQNHPYTNIISNDDRRGRRVGWLCRTSGKEWYITLTQIRYLPQATRLHMRTLQGRRGFAELFNRGVNPLDLPEV